MVRIRLCRMLPVYSSDVVYTALTNRQFMPPDFVNYMLSVYHGLINGRHLYHSSPVS